MKVTGNMEDLGDRIPETGLPVTSNKLTIKALTTTWADNALKYDIFFSV